MKKLLAILGVAVGVTCLADIEYLYWEVDLESSNPNNVPDFSYATVKAAGSSTYLYFYDTLGKTDRYKLAADDYEDVGDTGPTASPLYSGLDASTPLSQSFLFELWQEIDADTTKRVGWATYTLNEMQDYVFQTVGSGGGDTALSIEVIPEPASGLLVLLGLAGFARRKRGFGKKHSTEV